MSSKNLKFAFIGAGNIANAIIGGLIGKKLLCCEDVFVYDNDKAKYSSDIMRKVNCCLTMKEAIEPADIIVFALKPTVLPIVAKQISGGVTGFENKTYLTVAAGVSTDFLCSCMSSQVPIIRAMPNTPLLLGEGAVAISRNSMVSDKLFSYVCRLFSSISVISVIDESMMDGVVAVNGSSPAYVYLFYKAMLDGAALQGIPEDKAAALILQSIRGALMMIERTDKTPDELIKAVSSPNGTTVAALSVLNERGFKSAIEDAMTACTNRAVEMSKEVEGSLS